MLALGPRAVIPKLLVRLVGSLRSEEVCAGVEVIRAVQEGDGRADQRSGIVDGRLARGSISQKIVKFLVAAAEGMREAAGGEVNTANDCGNVVSGLVERVQVLIVLEVVVYVVLSTHEVMAALWTVVVDTRR